MHYLDLHPVYSWTFPDCPWVERAFPLNVSCSIVVHEWLVHNNGSQEWIIHIHFLKLWHNTFTLSFISPPPSPHVIKTLLQKCFSLDNCSINSERDWFIWTDHCREKTRIDSFIETHRISHHYNTGSQFISESILRFYRAHQRLEKGQSDSLVQTGFHMATCDVETSALFRVCFL